MANPVSNTVNADTVPQGANWTKTFTIDGGQDLSAGAVLGVITTGGNLKLVDATAVDGSQNAKYVLAYDIDTTADSNAAASGEVYITGRVNEDQLSYATGETDAQIAVHIESLRGVSIIAIKPNDTISIGDNS